MQNTIKTKISNIIKALHSVAEVNVFERSCLEKTPTVNITSAENMDDKWSTAQNMQGYQFTIRAFIPIKGIPQTVEFDKSNARAESILGDVVDDILNALDSDVTLGGVVDNSRVTPSSWGYVPAGEGLTRTADIKFITYKIKLN